MIKMAPSGNIDDNGCSDEWNKDAFESVVADLESDQWKKKVNKLNDIPFVSMGSSGHNPLSQQKDWPYPEDEDDEEDIENLARRRKLWRKASKRFAKQRSLHKLIGSNSKADGCEKSVCSEGTFETAQSSITAQRDNRSNPDKKSRDLGDPSFREAVPPTQTPHLVYHNHRREIKHMADDPRASYGRSMSYRSVQMPNSAHSTESTESFDWGDSDDDPDAFAWGESAAGKLIDSSDDDSVTSRESDSTPKRTTTIVGLSEALHKDHVGEDERSNLLLGKWLDKGKQAASNMEVPNDDRSLGSRKSTGSRRSQSQRERRLVPKPDGRKVQSEHGGHGGHADPRKENRSIARRPPEGNDRKTKSREDGTKRKHRRTSPRTGKDAKNRSTEEILKKPAMRRYVSENGPSLRRPSRVEPGDGETKGYSTEESEDIPSKPAMRRHVSENAARLRKSSRVDTAESENRGYSTEESTQSRKGHRMSRQDASDLKNKRSQWGADESPDQSNTMSLHQHFSLGQEAVRRSRENVSVSEGTRGADTGISESLGKSRASRGRGDPNFSEGSRGQGESKRTLRRHKSEAKHRRPSSRSENDDTSDSSAPDKRGVRRIKSAGVEKLRRRQKAAATDGKGELAPSDGRRDARRPEMYRSRSLSRTRNTSQKYQEDKCRRHSIQAADGDADLGRQLELGDPRSMPSSGPHGYAMERWKTGEAESATELPHDRCLERQGSKRQVKNNNAGSNKNEHARPANSRSQRCLERKSSFRVSDTRVPGDRQRGIQRAKSTPNVRRSLRPFQSPSRIQDKKNDTLSVEGSSATHDQAEDDHALLARGTREKLDPGASFVSTHKQNVSHGEIMDKENRRRLHALMYQHKMGVSLEELSKEVSRKGSLERLPSTRFLEVAEYD